MLIRSGSVLRRAIAQPVYVSCDGSEATYSSSGATSLTERNSSALQIRERALTARGKLLAGAPCLAPPTVTSTPMPSIQPRPACVSHRLAAYALSGAETSFDDFLACSNGKAVNEIVGLRPGASTYVSRPSAWRRRTASARPERSFTLFGMRIDKC